MKKRILLSLAICAVAAQAQSLGPLVVDLRTGAIFDLGPTAPTKSLGTHTIPYATVQVTPQSGCPETPFRGLISLNLTPGSGIKAATHVRLTVEYEGGGTLPRGWTTHIGDDSANDGFGGGSGLNGVAEAHVLDQNFSIYSAALSPGEVDRVVHQELRLAKGALHFDVANQYLSWGQPFNEVNAPFGKKLFAIGGAGADNRLFIGLNRVISGRPDRIGCGAKRAIVEFQ